MCETMRNVNSAAMERRHYGYSDDIAAGSNPASLHQKQGDNMIKIIDIILAVILFVLVLIYAFVDLKSYDEDMLLIAILMTTLILGYPKDKF